MPLELPDSTLALLREGYHWIQGQCERHGSDVFRARLAGREVICMRGAEAARLFYDPARFRRAGAAPRRIQKSLFGERGVQTLDGQAHVHRKAMFMSLMTPEGIDHLVNLHERNWHAAIADWETRERVVLFDQAQEILCKAVCAWAGVPLDTTEARARATQLGHMVDAFGALGPRHWRGRVARRRTEAWIEDFVHAVRNGELPVAELPGGVVALHRGRDGRLLEPRVAAVEILNLLRPTVAIATYVAFAALALHEFPEVRRRLPSGNGQYLRWFVQEVRRYYPFGPFLGARVRQAFEWRGHEFSEGLLVLLDIYGTNHDARLWPDPDSFRPERFRDWQGGAYDCIPQGGGDHYSGHRCAGEWLTIALLGSAVRQLTGAMNYEVPEQRLAYSLRRMPTGPPSGFVIAKVRPTRRPAARSIAAR